MKRLLALLLTLVMVMGLFAACGGKTVKIEIEDKEEDSEETEESAETTETTEENTTEDTTVPEETENNGVRVYVATVVDQDGNPVEGVMVQFCDENGCTPAMTDEEGKVRCQTLNEKTVKIMEMPGGYTYATEQEEWDFAEGDEVTIVLQKQGSSKPNTQGNSKPNTQGNSKPNTQGGNNQGGGNSASTEPPVEEETEDPTEDFDVDFGDLT